MLVRSIYRDRVIYANACRVVEDVGSRVVTAVLPGDEYLALVGERMQILADIASGSERTEIRIWDKHRVLWVTQIGESYSIGLFWDATSGVFKGYYVNLQAPAQRSPFGIDAGDQVLDIIVRPDGTWFWKDEDELEYAVQVGMFSADEAVQIRRNGERVMAQRANLLPTGWEDWRPDPTWGRVLLPAGWDRISDASNVG